MLTLKVLEAVANTSSKNEKEAILSEHKENSTLKQVCEYAYAPTMSFFMRKIPDHTPVGEGVSWTEFFAVLDTLRLRKKTGNEAQQFVAEYLNTLSPEFAELFIKIVRKDLKTGCKDATINKVWKGLIVKPPRMGAASMNEKSLANMRKIKNLAIELKSDGTYLSSVCGELSTSMTRNGSPITIEPLQDHLSCGAFDGFALEGEGVYDLSKADRSTGNGIVTKIVKGTASFDEKGGLMLQVWDCIDITFYQPKSEWKVSNQDRRKLLEEMMERYEMWCTSNNVEPKIFLIERHENVSVEQAFEIFEGHVRSGMEGSIVKDMDKSWKDVGKPSFCIKLKRKEPADLKVVGIFMAEEGSKYEGMLGGFICESECGEIKVRVGSGFNDDDRVKYLEEDNFPPIIEVEYDSITEDKKTKQKSLFLPIFKRPRYDKDVADTLAEIKDKVRIK
ncbi:nucleic acid-binding, OB-fold protein [Vibrio phage 1.063.O._10N.261.45.C7]|nr:nucleic acid-binding, OB-fold protein [Vibrio phage 1.063.O._10N.261.45.C7]